MNRNQDRNYALPLRGSLAWAYAPSLLIAVLMAVASIAGLLQQTVLYPTDELLQSFMPTDVSILCIGLPMLLGSLWLTRRGRLLGLLLWPGALFYVFYIYLTYVLVMPLNAAYLLHLALVMLSAYALIALLAAIDGKAVEQRLAGAVPARASGAILAVLGALFFLRALSIIVGALAAQTPIAETDIAVNTSDLLIAPAWVVCGLLLWRREAFGYVAGLGLLFQASMLFIGLIIIMLLQPYLTNAALSLVDVAIVLLMGLICFIPFALFIRGAASDRSSRSI